MRATAITDVPNGIGKRWSRRSSQIGPDAQAAVVLLNKTFGLSHVKVAAVFHTLFGITLTRGAGVQIVPRAADRLGPACQEVHQEIKSSPCLTPDETGRRVAGQPAWPHAWVAERATGYAIDLCRKADVLERLIGIDWSGKMVHDGFASYDRFKAATHQQCRATCSYVCANGKQRRRGERWSHAFQEFRALAGWVQDAE